MVQGKRRDIGLGSATTSSLTEARLKAGTNRRIARAGVDPPHLLRRALSSLALLTALQGQRRTTTEAQEYYLILRPSPVASESPFESSTALPQRSAKCASEQPLLNGGSGV
jgi:hypothetical protein